MAYMEWNDSYSVGVKKFDEEHKKLIEMISELHDAMLKGQGRVAVGAIINGLIEYTEKHFSSEEDLFDKLGYSETESHKSAHKKFVNEVSDFKSKFEKGEMFLSLEVMKFLKDWLLTHILKVDKNYRSFFNSKGEF